jgi:hypothetical protein
MTRNNASRKKDKDVFNDESAGKRRSGKTRKGDPWLRTVLCQAAWAASHTKRTYLSAQYHRIAAKRGRKRAIIAVAHSILVIAYILLRRGEVYRDLGADYFERLNPFLLMLELEARKWQRRSCGRQFRERFVGILPGQRASEAFQKMIYRLHSPRGWC